MNSKQIDYCIELARTRNFTRAAENMYVSQPTFSYQIRQFEEEVGFQIFERSGRGAALTPAGSQFISYLSRAREEMKRAVEQGQNFSARYKDDISISLQIRQSLYFLPEAIRLFEKEFREVQITPRFSPESTMESFLSGESDILFTLKENARQIPGIRMHELFKSRIYLICDRNDPLSRKNEIKEEDLYERTLMVGGGSPPLLRALQQKLIATGKIDYFNSPDHDTTLTNVAAGKGICLAPGFLNDHSGQFSWIPYDTGEGFDCVLLTHESDSRKSLERFIDIISELYEKAVAFPL